MRSRSSTPDGLSRTRGQAMQALAGGPSVFPAPRLMLRSGEVEPIEIHDLAPRGSEVARELLLRVAARVDLGDCPELRVGAKHEVEAPTGPLVRARRPVMALEGVLGLRRRVPGRAHVEQIDEEVVAEDAGPVGEDPEIGLVVIRVEDAHAADENR